MLFLIEGPAGSGKSQRVAEMLRAGEVDIVADYTAMWAALRGMERDEGGRYPVRRADDPTVRTGLNSYMRRTAVRQGLRSGLRVAVTSGTPGTAPTYAEIAAELQVAFETNTLDPGIDAARRQLARRFSRDGVIEPECEEALVRWYGERLR